MHHHRYHHQQQHHDMKGVTRIARDTEPETKLKVIIGDPSRPKQRAETRHAAQSSETLCWFGRPDRQSQPLLRHSHSKYISS